MVAADLLPNLPYLASCGSMFLRLIVHISNCEWRASQTPRVTNPLDHRRCSCNASTRKPRAEGLLMDALTVASKIVARQMGGIDVPAMHTEATRRALTNVLIHSDYSSAGGNAVVALSDDTPEVNDSSRCRFGLTPVMLFQLQKSTLWTPWIANVFYRLQPIETWNCGTLQITSLMKMPSCYCPLLQRAL